METTDLKSKIGVAEMSLDQVVKILDKQLGNDNLLFTQSLDPMLNRFCTSLLGAHHYD